MNGKAFKFILIAVVGGILLTGILLFMPQYVPDAEAMTDLNYGMPFGFLNQYSTVVFVPSEFPRYMIIQPWSTYFSYKLNGFALTISLISNICIFAAAEGIIVLLRGISRRKHPEKYAKKQKKDVAYNPVFK